VTTAAPPSIPIPGAQPALPIPVFATRTPPEIATAQAGVLVDADSGRVLWARDADQPRPIASLTKIFTAMEAAGAVSNLDQPVVVPREAVTGIPWDSTVMGLTPGETVTVRQLLYGMFLPSGNDAAVTLADTLLPEPQFIAGMNRLAAAMGLRRTHFTNPWGADGADHHSSAADLAVAASYLDRHFPQLASIAATASMEIPAAPGHKAFHLRTLNKLLGSYPGLDGLKTGWTGGAGGCLVSTANREGHHLVAVLLGSGNTFAETGALLDYGFSLEQPVSQR
jgi:D-alanyl-D-alanine carboxypeptidase